MDYLRNNRELCNKIKSVDLTDLLDERVVELRVMYAEIEFNALDMEEWSQIIKLGLDLYLL